MDHLQVYTRAGCGYSSLLLGTLKRHGVATDVHDIWTDRAAREFVRRHNHGNETVPTVVLDDHVWTNPAPQSLLEAIRRDRPDLITEPLPRPPRLARWRRRRPRTL